MQFHAEDLVDGAFVILNGYKHRIIHILIIILLNATLPAIASEEDLSNFEGSEIPVWQDCEGSNWYEGSDPDHKDVQRSGSIECTGVSRICTNVTGPAKISFWWKSDVANKKVGQLSFIVDDTIYICNSTGWVPISYPIWDNNTHKLTWEFRKIRCYPKNIGAGWIGDIYIEYGDSTIPHGFKTPISEPISITSNISIVPAGITIVSSEVTIAPTNVSMDASEVKIAPANVTMDISEIKISTTNILISNETSNKSDKPTPKILLQNITVTDDENVSGNNYTTTIKDALENIKDHGIIYIEKQVCNEDIEINRPVKLIGLNYPELRPNDRPECVDQDGKYLTVVTIINSSDVWIEGFEICEFELNNSLHKRGIYVKGGCNNISIINNIIHGSNGKDLIHGIYTKNCKNITIFNNTIYDLSNNGSSGIYIELCSGYCNISKNNIDGTEYNNQMIGSGIYITKYNGYNVIKELTLFNNTMVNLDRCIVLEDLNSIEKLEIINNTLNNATIFVESNCINLDRSKLRRENFIPTSIDDSHLYIRS